MNILISNDDGINASGIKALSEAIGKDYNVYVAAPDRERSAAGHSITLTTPLRVDEIEPLNGSKKSWSVTGTPGDCVKIALNAILKPEEMPDLIISGINHGPNLGYDILYSGTVSCAIEGAMFGIPSLAVSLNILSSEYNDFRFAANFVNTLIPKLKDFKIPSRSILNINVPSVSPEDIGGIAITEMGGRMFNDKYEKRIDPRGKTYYWMAGELSGASEKENTDIEAIRRNQISITPLSFDTTRKEIISDLNEILCSDNMCNWFN